MTKKDSIHVTSHTKTHNTVAPALTVNEPTIDYAITQKENTYVLSGNFKDRSNRWHGGVYPEAWNIHAAGGLWCRKAGAGDLRAENNS